MNVKVRQIGDAMVVALPADVAARHGLQDGDELIVSLDADGFRLRIASEVLERQRVLALGIMDQHREALDLLAR